MDGPLGELGESKVLGALVEIKFLGAFGSGLGFKCFESCFLCTYQGFHNVSNRFSLL